MKSTFIDHPQLTNCHRTSKVPLRVVEHEPGKFKIVALGGGFVDNHIKKTDLDGEPVDVMSIQLVEAFLAMTALRKTKVSADEALLSAQKITSYYPPAIVNLEDLDKQIHFGYTRMELNRLYTYFLMTYCDFPPMQALDNYGDKWFWRNMFQNKQTALTFSKIYGKPEDQRIAKLIQRKQTIDLLLLRRGLSKLIIEDSVHAVFDKPDVHTCAEISQMADEYYKCQEIILELIDEIIDRPRAESWLSAPTLFKYTDDWLKDVWNQTLDEIRQWQCKVQDLSFDYSIEYPVLFFSGRPILKIDDGKDNQVTVVNSELVHLLARKAAGEVEMLDPILAEFFLTSVGVTRGGLEPRKAQDIAQHVVNCHSAYIAAELAHNKVFTRFDLHKLCLKYLGIVLNTENPKRSIATEELDKFRWALFPDARSTYNPLPQLVGAPERIKEAAPLRNVQFAELLTRGRAAARLIEKLIESQVHPEEFLRAYRIRVLNYIETIYEREPAEEWLSTSVLKYDKNWLREEMRRLWETAQKEWETKQCDLGDASCH